jgi:hypothetical protein
MDALFNYLENCIAVARMLRSDSRGMLISEHGDSRVARLDVDIGRIFSNPYKRRRKSL